MFCELDSICQFEQICFASVILLFFDTLARGCRHTATHCNSLQHTATHCNTLQHTEIWRTVSARLLQHAAKHCNTLPYTAPHRDLENNFSTLAAPHCTTLHHITAHCTSLHLTATHCNTLQHTAAHSSTLQHTARHGDLANGLSALAGFGELLAYRGFALILRQVREPGHLLRRHLQCVAVCCSVVQ